MKQSWWREKPLDNKILIIFLYISKKTPQIRFLQEVFGKEFSKKQFETGFINRVGHLMYKINVK